MWKEGEELVVPSKDTTKSGRLWVNFCGSVSYMAVTLFAFFIISKITNSNIGPMIGLIILFAMVYVCYYCVAAIYRSYFPEEDKIVFGKDGIFVMNGRSFKWDDIEYVYCGEEEKFGSSNNQTPGLILQSQASKLPKRKKQINYQALRKDKKKITCLHILYKNPDDNYDQYHYQKPIDSYSYSSGEITAAVEYWSGRDIGNKSDLTRDQYVDRLVKKGMLTEEEGESKKEKFSLLVPLFEVYEKQKVYLYVGLGVIVVLAMVFEFLLHSDAALDRTPYIGKYAGLLYLLGPFSLYMVVLMFAEIIHKKRFVGQKGIGDLTDDEFDECSMIASSELKSKSARNTEKTMTYILVGIYAIICLVWVALLVYLYMYKNGNLS